MNIITGSHLLQLELANHFNGNCGFSQNISL
jgi:hypothetical protein